MDIDLARDLPKVELHVHLEGSIRPETVLKLRRPEDTAIPDTLDGLRDWYVFRDFPHFVDVYVAVSKLLRTPDDIELVLREFLDDQAAQNVTHTEVTFTASTIEKHRGISWDRQKQALAAGLRYGREELGVSCGLVLDIVRGDSLERADEVVDWAIDGFRDGLVLALGLSGEERLGGAGTYAKAIERAREAGLPFVPHAGETVGPESIQACLPFEPARIGHGVRAIEDLRLVAELRDRQIPLEVNPTSNVRLGVFPSLEAHPLPRLLDEGVRVSINSDDGPMFGTTVSDEYARCAETFGLSSDVLYTLVQGAASDSLLPAPEKAALRDRIREDWPG